MLEPRERSAEAMIESRNRRIDFVKRFLQHHNHSCEKWLPRLKNVDLSHTAYNLKSYKYVDLTLFRKTLH